jgi:hypothetical protein
MTSEVDAARLPATAAYLAALPAGLASHPECQAKASLYRAFVGERAPPGLPEVLLDLVLHPRPVTAWIPEVYSHALLLAHYDMDGHDHESFARFTYDSQRALWNSKLYAFLMKLVSPARLITQAGSRWSQFHRGSDLSAEERGPGRGELILRHPPSLYDEISLIGLTEGLRAVLDVSRVRSQLQLVERTDLGARWRVDWDD